MQIRIKIIPYLKKKSNSTFQSQKQNQKQNLDLLNITILILKYNTNHLLKQLRSYYQNIIFLIINLLQAPHNQIDWLQIKMQEVFNNENRTEKTDSNHRSKKITLIICKQMLGNGRDLETMDYSYGIHLPQASIIFPVLKNLGYDVQIVDWQDQTISWREQGQLILGTVWGYTQKIDKFTRFLEHLQKQNLQLTNNTKLVKWNSTKNYLNDLKQHNFLIPNTLIFQSDSNVGLKQALALFKQQYQNQDVIVKGLADASALGYLHICQENLEQATLHFERLQKQFGGVVMQSFIPQLCKKSQFSYVFLDGKLSHFYLKVPQASCQKVQEEYGGRSFCIKRDLSNITEVIQNVKQFRTDFELTEQQVKKMCIEVGKFYPQFLQFLKKLELDPPTYIRVDCVLVNNSLMIMQLEAVEPYLMLGQSTSIDPENNTIKNYIEAVIKPS